nr:response regulator [Desulfobulbaceae bacterium]
MHLLHSILPKRIYSQIALAITAILIATSLTYALVISNQQAQYAQKAMEHNAEVLVDSFVKACAHMLIVEDYSGLDTFLLQAAKHSDLESIQVVDSDGTTITSIIHPQGFTPYINYTATSLQAQPASNPPQATYNNSSYLLQLPIIAGNVLGYIRVSFSLKEIRKTKHAIWKRTLLLGTIWILLSIVLLLQILKRPIESIKKLTDFTRQLSTHRGAQLPVDRSCLELEQFGQALNAVSNELLQSEQELSAEKDRLSITLQSISDGVIATDRTGKIVLFNKAAELITGWQAHKALGSSLEAVFSDFESESANPAELIREIIDQQKTIRQGVVHSFPQKGNLPDTTVAISVAPIVAGTGEKTGAVLICKDLTEQLASDKEKISLENQLQQALKMEAIGTLAGGIAHDFNNILTPILGYAQLVEYQLPPESDLLKYQREVIVAANRAKELVQQILTFSRSADHELLPLQIQIVVKEAVKLIRSTIPTTIQIKQDINPNCGYVLASPTQVHQIVMNLCTNAYHAMRIKGGELSISLQPVKIPNDDHTDTTIRPGEYILLQISDTGSGVPKTIIDRIFDPYFTTKPLGEGTGMGLSVVHGIVKNCKGHISVTSVEGQGASFKIYLPQEKSNRPALGTSSSVKPAGGSERILLVDDDITIVDIESRILRSLGYQVTAFSSSEEALAAFQQSTDSFDLVFTDMTMPQITGIGLMKKIRALRPDMPIILCTGYSEIIDQKSALALGINAYITKPLVLETVATQVRKALDNKS